MPSLSQLIHHLLICGSLITNKQTIIIRLVLRCVAATDFPLTLFKMKLKKIHSQDSLYDKFSPFTNKALISHCVVSYSVWLLLLHSENFPLSHSKANLHCLQVKTNTEDYLLLVLGPGSAELSTTQPLSQTLHCHNKEPNFPNKSESLCNHASMLFRNDYLT